MQLNGWRRIAIVFTSAWILAAVGLAVFEWAKKKDGFFVHLSLPAGTVIKGAEAVLPDGRKLQLNQKLAGRDTKPWEIKWDDEPEVPTTRQINWTNVLFFGLAFPTLLWGAAECFVAVAHWIRRGFGTPK